MNENIELVKDFSDFDTSIYWNAAKKFLPEKIKILIVAESPPAFNNDYPTSYFYFSECPKADLLFYTIIKAIYNIDFQKGIDDRIKVLEQFKNDGYFLIDSVDYPINKDRNGNKISNKLREKIINNNKREFLNRIKYFQDCGIINKQTKIMLIKATVFHQLKDSFNNIMNKTPIRFPNYVKDRVVIQDIRELLNIYF